MAMRYDVGEVASISLAKVDTISSCGIAHSSLYSHAIGILGSEKDFLHQSVCLKPLEPRIGRRHHFPNDLDGTVHPLESSSGIGFEPQGIKG